MVVKMGRGVVDMMRSWEKWEKKEVGYCEKKIPRNAVQSTYLMGIRGKIIKWWGGGCSREGTHYVWWWEANGRGKRRGTWTCCLSKEIGVEKEETNLFLEVVMVSVGVGIWGLLLKGEESLWKDQLCVR